MNAVKRPRVNWLAWVSINMANVRARRGKKTDEVWLLSYADMITNLLIFFVAMLSMSDISRVKMERVQEQLSGSSSSVSLRSIEADLSEYIKKQGYSDVVKVNLTDRGVEISINSGIVFPIGSEKIDPQWIPILDEVMVKLKTYAYKYEFAIEGHSDDTPVKSGNRFQSNWELSSARAHEVRIRMEYQGIPGNKLRVESYGDTRHLPAQELENLSEAEIKSRHRRVVIRVF